MCKYFDIWFFFYSLQSRNLPKWKVSKNKMNLPLFILENKMPGKKGYFIKNFHQTNLAALCIFLPTEIMVHKHHQTSPLKMMMTEENYLNNFNIEMRCQ